MPEDLAPVVVVAEKLVYFGYTADVELRPLVLERAKIASIDMTPLEGRPTLEFEAPSKVIALPPEAATAFEFDPEKAISAKKQAAKEAQAAADAAAAELKERALKRQKGIRVAQRQGGGKVRR